METIEYRTIDKSGWGNGAWVAEPDKKQWKDPTTGLPCLIVRNPVGALCGYVGVPNGHPAYGKDYDDVEVDVHGGLTFAHRCAKTPTEEDWQKWREHLLARRDEAKQYPRGDVANALRDRAAELDGFDAYSAWVTAAHICHKVAAGESDDVWWLGFDCAHSGDLCPTSEMRIPSSSYLRSRETYKDIAYVMDQVTSLAAQLAAKV